MRKSLLLNLSEVDLTAPTAPTVIAPVGWQNGEVTVKVIDGTDESSGVNRSKYRIDNGLWQTYENEFIITEAGETIVEARTIDHAGNISAITSETIMIDKTSPEITFDKDGGDWAKSHATKIVVTDEYSGVEQIGYAWSTSEDFPTNGFTTYTDGTIITTPSETGTYYLHVRSNDYAGNVSELTSKAFKVDVTAPNVPTITAPIGWQNSDVTVEITDGIDEHLVACFVQNIELMMVHGSLMLMRLKFHWKVKSRLKQKQLIKSEMKVLLQA